VNDIAAVIEFLIAIAAAIVILWFVWRVFIRRYWRVVRIRHARDRREIEEAAARRRE
jgi:hypothetical protein